LNIWNVIINSGRLPEKPHGTINWLPSTKLNTAIIYNEQITRKRKEKENIYRDQ